MKCGICKSELTGSGKRKYCSDFCRKEARKKSWRKYLDTHREEQRLRVKLHQKNNLHQYDNYRKVHKLENNARTRARYAMKKAGILKRCNKCHKTTGRIDVHHKDENPFNNDLNNLEYLCSLCHGKIHRD